MKAILSNPPITPSIESLKRHFSFEQLVPPAPVGEQDLLAFKKNFKARGGYAAVLIPIVNNDDGLGVLLTRRAEHLRNHPGQISFPGGRIEKHDDSHIATALRETEEEIGLSADNTEIIGHLEDYYTVTGFCVTPVIGIIHGKFELTADPNEVAEIIQVPLDHLMSPDNFELVEHEYQSRRRYYYSTRFGRHRIWGATAGIIMNLYRSLAQTHLV